MSKFPITVFYHCYIPDTSSALYWNWWIDEQLGVIEKSKLYEVADVKMAITMPKYWVNLGKYVTPNGFEGYVKKYINNRYPFAEILDIRDTGENNIYEGQTLRFLHDHCKKTDGYVLYFHTKGLTSLCVETKVWRNLLEEVLINQWQMRFFEIEKYDCLGVLDGNPIVYSANFFWAKNSYIASLPAPTSTSNRYYYETWININKPNRGVVLDFKNKDMYKELYFYNKINFSKL
jgi:hypothetical protein